MIFIVDRDSIGGWVLPQEKVFVKDWTFESDVEVLPEGVGRLCSPTFFQYVEESYFCF